MSCANALRSSSSTMAFPPYLTTTVRPWNRAIHGSASASVSAFSSAAHREVVIGTRSCGVRRVLLDIGMGQVVGPDGRLARSPPSGRS